MNPQSKHESSGSSGIRGPLFVNAALIGLLAFVALGAPSVAQYRAPGMYHGISATAPGTTSDVILIVDEANQAMIGLAFDSNTGKFAPAGKRDLAVDSMNLRTR
jgi:hypothetical protein